MPSPTVKLDPDGRPIDKATGEEIPLLYLNSEGRIVDRRAKPVPSLKFYPPDRILGYPNPALIVTYDGRILPSNNRLKDRFDLGGSYIGETPEVNRTPEAYVTGSRTPGDDKTPEANRTPEGTLAERKHRDNPSQGTRFPLVDTPRRSGSLGQTVSPRPTRPLKQTGSPRSTRLPKRSESLGRPVSPRSTRPLPARSPESGPFLCNDCKLHHCCYAAAQAVNHLNDELHCNCPWPLSSQTALYSLPVFRNSILPFGMSRKVHRSLCPLQNNQYGPHPIPAP